MRALPASLGVASAGFLLTSLAIGGATPAYAATPEILLGTAESYAVLAGSTVANTGPSVITGDLGVAPGSAVTGFPPGTVLGEIHASDAHATQAQVDLTTAYNDAAARPATADLTGQDLGGMTLVDGVYAYSTSAQLTGTLTLDAQGDPDSVFVIQTGSTLTTASDSAVNLINGASPCNVFWQIGSSATLGTRTDFAGTVMALTSVTLVTEASVEGRVLARNGAVALDSNVITAPSCAPVVVPPVTPPVTPPVDETPPDAPTTPPADETPPTTTTPNTPIVPPGHPETGLGGSVDDQQGPAMLLLVGGLLAGVAATALAAVPRLRRH